MSVLDHLRHPGWARGALFGLGLLLVLTTIIRLVLDPVAAHFTRKQDRVPGRNAAATVIPIQGRLGQPDVQIWPTILGVARNAFVEGDSAGFAHIPPPVSPEKESMLTQATHALQRDKGPPKAQPPKIETGSDKK